MRVLQIVSVSLAVLATSSSASLFGRASKQVCDVKASPSTCPKDQFCKAATSGSKAYCNPKLEGGKQCSSASNCQSGICFPPNRSGKKTCAAVPTSNYPLKAQCTQAKQCASKYCNDLGYCDTRNPAGGKCTGDGGCSDAGSKCLTQSTLFVVYDSDGFKHSKQVPAGRCSYTTDLGEGMACSSNANCYSKGFTCSSKTKQCVANAPTNLPTGKTCEANSWCASGFCVSGACGCKDNTGCTAGTQRCDTADHTCKKPSALGGTCSSNNMCQDGGICLKGVCQCSGDAICTGTSRCDTADNTCKKVNSFGGACTSDLFCKDGSVCVNGTCGCRADSTNCPTGKVCGPDAQCYLPAGATCSRKKDCLSGDCDQRGCTCSSTSLCPSDRFCHPTAKVCLIPFGGGYPCSKDSMCMTNTCTGEFCSCDAQGCRYEWQTCVNSECVGNPFVDNASCTSGDQCASSFCNDGQCGCASTASCGANQWCDRPLGQCTDNDPNALPYGATCSSRYDCASHWCDHGQCACLQTADCPSQQLCDLEKQTCYARTNVPDLEACQWDSECASGKCVSGRCGCSSDQSCGYNSWCKKDMTCGWQARMGDPCPTLEDKGCVTGVCNPNGVCGCSSTNQCDNSDSANPQRCSPVSHTCRWAIGDPGSGCNEDSICRSGTCTDGTCA